MLRRTKCNGQKLRVMAKAPVVIFMRHPERFRKPPLLMGVVGDVLASVADAGGGGVPELAAGSTITARVEMLVK